MKNTQFVIKTSTRTCEISAYNIDEALILAKAEHIQAGEKFEVLSARSREHGCSLFFDDLPDTLTFKIR